MSNRKNQSPKKTEVIVERFITGNGEDIAGGIRDNVNLATSERIKRAKKPNQGHYIRAIAGRRTDRVSDQTIKISKDELNCVFIFRCGINALDMGNPMYGLEDGSNYVNLNNNIERALELGAHVIVVYSDAFGTEWEMKRLNNAKIAPFNPDDKDNTDEVLEYYPLGSRMDFVARDVERVLKHEGVEVYFMNGAQEEKINKYFNIDIMEKLMKKLGNNPRIHYIKGVNTMVNLEQELKDGTSRFATVGFLSNNSLSKACKGPLALSAVVQNSGVNSANEVFALNTNIVGKKGDHLHCPSSESTFVETAAKKMPAKRARGRNVYTLSVPQNGEITLIEGFGLPKSKPLEMIVFEQYAITEAKRIVLRNRLEDELNKTALPTDTDPVRGIMQYINNARRNRTPKPAPVVEQPATPVAEEDVVKEV